MWKFTNYPDCLNTLQEGIIRLFSLHSWLAYSFECCVVVS